jgi:hypothetical protein
MGFCLGYTLMKKKFPFSAKEEIKGKKPTPAIMILRYFTGIAGIAIIYTGLRLIFPGEQSIFNEIPIWGMGSPYYELGNFIRYGLVGLWISAGAPMIFQRLGLSSNKLTAQTTLVAPNEPSEPK